MTSTNTYTCALATAILLAVSGTPAAAAEPTTDDLREFEQALARDYQALAGAEQAQGDRRDAETYAERAAAAGRGQPSAPDQVELRQAFLADTYAAELSGARQRLVTALDAGGRERAPAPAARAQSAYDCWLEQATEDLQAADIAACRQTFLSALAEVEQSAVVVAQIAPAAPAPNPPPALAAVSPPPERYRVYFDFDRADVTPAAHEVLAALKRDVDTSGAERIIATGHTSTIGTSAHNQRLSQRRAEAVKVALLALEVRAGTIETAAHGENDLLVATADGVREPQNRRVDLVVER